MVKPKFSFTIDRSLWYRGNDGAQLLLDKGSKDEGKMCCIGIFCKALGLKDESLLGIGFPADLETKEQKGLYEKLHGGTGAFLLYEDDGYYRDSDATNSLTEINDDKGITEKEREKEIAALFGANGVEVKFK